jgi:hypothetical protein
VYVLLRLFLGGCVRCVKRLIPGGEEKACIELNVNSKYACTIIGIGCYGKAFSYFGLRLSLVCPEHPHSSHKYKNSRHTSYVITLIVTTISSQIVAPSRRNDCIFSDPLLRIESSLLLSALSVLGLPTQHYLLHYQLLRVTSHSPIMCLAFQLVRPYNDVRQLGLWYSRLS